MVDAVVIIPTYNEIENVERIIKNVLSLQRDFDILIIDDNSPDKTAIKIKELQSEYREKLFLIEREGKLGLGTAYITGFKWALERSYEYLSLIHI